MSRSRRPSPQTLLLLTALIDQPSAWRYGYDLSQEIGLASGTLYPLLIRLHQKALLEAQWNASTVPGRPPRHAYRLTAEGLAYAKAALRDEGAVGFQVSALPRT